MAIARLARQLIDFCYPGVCAACEAPCDGSAALCFSCNSQVVAIETSPGCMRCGMPIAQHDAPCPYCLGKGLYPFERVIRLGPFREPLSQLIYQTKYHRKWPLAEFLGDRLMAQSRVQTLLMETNVLVPVPLHRLRQIARGYNQADVIARRLAARDRKLKIAHPAVRLRNTETQTHQQSRQKRAENLRDAFGLVDDRRIKGKHVVIVDDVMTTAATMQSLGRTLLEAEPASLCALVVAIADPKGRDFEAI